MTALLRSITLFTAIALLLFMGLHAVVPHDHPHVEGTHFSEVPPMAHAENKIFILIIGLAVLPTLLRPFLELAARSTQTALFFQRQSEMVASTVPIRYAEALRKGRIHSRAD